MEATEQLKELEYAIARAERALWCAERENATPEVITQAEKDLSLAVDTYGIAWNEKDTR